MDLKQLHQLKCELLKVYRYQGLTLQELLCEFYSHINEVINSTNGLIDIVDYLVGEGLSNEVATHLNQMLIDGTFDKIISNKVNELSTNLINQFNEMKKIIEYNISESDKLIENLKIYDSRFINIENKNIEQDTRIKEVENKNKVQDVYINGLFNENKDGRLSVEGEGNDLKLEGSKEGLVEIDKIVGNTFVNIANNTFNRVSDSIRRMDIKNLLKTDTTYTIISTLDTIKYQWAILNSSKTILGYNNQKVLTFTTDTSSIMVYIRFNSNYTNETKINVAELYDKIMILEGDYTNKPIPSQYFEGLKSSFEENLVTEEMIEQGLEDAENLGKYKVPIRLIGKNLFTDINSVVGFLSNGTIVSNTTLSKTTDYIKVQYNTNYTIHCDNGDSYLRRIEFYDSDKNYLNDYVSYSADTTKTFRTSYFNVKYIRISYDINATNIQLEEGTVATDCEEYFERTTNVYLNSPLLEGDTIENVDGKINHVHRYKQEVFDGSDDENWVIENATSTVYIACHDLYRTLPYDNTILVCDKLKTISGRYSKEYGICGYGNLGDYPTQNWIYVKIADYTNTRAWLKDNPIAVVYKLATPIYEIISEDKVILECANDSTLHIDSIVPVESVSASYTGGVPSVYAIEETGITNTVDISVTQTAVDFLLMSSMGESLMISFLNNVEGINNLGTYFASRIMKKALRYEDVINKYTQFKNDIDIILVNEGYEYLIK